MSEETTIEPMTNAGVYDRENVARALGVDVATLPDLTIRPEAPKPPAPIFGPLSDDEWRHVQPFIPPRVKCNSKIADRDLIDHALQAARFGFMWSLLQEAMPVEAVRAKMKRFSIYRTGNLWAELFDHVADKLSPARVAAFRLLADRGERERASVMDFRSKRRKTVLMSRGRLA